MVEWTLFAIKPSSYISGLCYSVLRLEPFGGCGYSCVYCYARWYRWGDLARPQWRVVRLWERVARRLSRLDGKPFFRLATLSDPLQPAETVSAASLEMLRTASRYGVPVVVNTKSDLVARSPWLDVLASLADRGLLLVQLSIGFGDRTASLLEPRAPPPARRLEALETLAEHSIPAVVRVQPLVPGLEEEQLAVAREALERGALGVIGESIRETRMGFKTLSRLLGYSVEEAAGGLEPYQLVEVEGREPLYHPSTAWRTRIHEALARLAQGYGRPYAACKDGVEPGYVPGRDCCLTWIAMPGRLLRPTLHEYLYLSREAGRPLTPREFVEECMERLSSRGYVCGDAVNQLPNPVSKAFRLHERKLLRLVESGRWRLLLPQQPVAGQEPIDNSVGGEG